MLWRRPRQLLFLCAWLDLAGVLLLGGLVARWRGSPLMIQPAWLLAFGANYLFFGWLFGSYTLLRWPWLRLQLVLLRLGLTALATLAGVILADWLLNLPQSFALTHRGTQVLLLALLSGWALAPDGRSGRGAPDPARVDPHPLCEHPQTAAGPRHAAPRHAAGGADQHGAGAGGAAAGAPAPHAAAGALAGDRGDSLEQ